MSALSQTAGQELVVYWSSRQSSSAIVLVIGLILMIALVSLIYGVLRYLRERLVQRLEHTSNSLERLASGSDDVDIVKRENVLHDINRLVRALESLNDLRLKEREAQ